MHSGLTFPWLPAPISPINSTAEWRAPIDAPRPLSLPLGPYMFPWNGKMSTREVTATDDNKLRMANALSCGEAPERCHLGCTRGVEKVGFVGSSEVFRPYIASIHDPQLCRIECSEHLRSRPQTQMFREIR